MIIIWRGLGFVVPVVIVLAIVTVELVTNGFLGKGFFSEHTWPKLVGAFLAGIVLRTLGIWMNNPANKYMNWNQDIRAGDVLEPESSHAFFFLPVQNWSYVILAYGLCVLTIDICKLITAGW